MAKSSKSYACQTCGASYSRWTGKCEACNEWNSIIEESTSQKKPITLAVRRAGRGHPIPFTNLKGKSADVPRHISGIKEFDRVVGGGLVSGSAILIGGDPGIGKSTLLLQVTCALAKTGIGCAYISGEESIDQIRMRAQRMGLADAPVHLASATSVTDILATLDDQFGPPIDVIVIDSIQTMHIDTIDSSPGTVTQVRTATQEIIRVAKQRGTIVLFVGHVTKEGTIAGPRVLEHIVDTVLYFEGDRGHAFRILRGVKNRFGTTDEIGVFEMANIGLCEVANPSALFLDNQTKDTVGSAVLAGIEGTRPLLVEVQALVAQTSFATPRRAVIGWDTGRLAMVVAVLETRCNVSLGSNDIYLNIAGGLRINEPAADLAVATALLSAQSNISVAPNTIIFGEIGLSGEIRSVSQIDQRLKEATKLGFKHAICPNIPEKRKKSIPKDLRITSIEHLSDLVPMFAP